MFRRDWAPITNTMVLPGDPYGDLATFSKGIIKSVYVAGSAAGGAAIEHVGVSTLYLGSYPTAPLTDTAHGDFAVRVKVAMRAAAATSGSLTVLGSWGGANSSATVPASLPAGASDVTVSIGAGTEAALWWPLGLGPQQLYNLTVTFVPAAGSAPVSAVRRIGFRVFAIVTGDDSDPGSLAGQDGSGNFTMRWRVNGANMWARGANVIPMHELRMRT